MKTNPYDGVFYINQASSLDELKAIFQKILFEYGFDLFAIQYKTAEQKRCDAQPHFLCNFPDEWVQHYYDSKYYDIDPVITLGKQHRRPYFWNKLWDGLDMSKHQKSFFNEADEHGVSCGIGLPILILNDEPGIVSFVSSVCSQKEIQQIMQEDHLSLALMATAFHHAADKFFEKRPHPLAPKLTPREKECLELAAIGKNSDEIGDILNISNRTVHFHLYGCFQKLDCVSREQAVAKAILMKLISPSPKLIPFRKTGTNG